MIHTRKLLVQNNLTKHELSNNCIFYLVLKLLKSFEQLYKSHCKIKHVFINIFHEKQKLLYFELDSFSNCSLFLRGLYILAYYITRQYTCNWIAPDVRFVYCERTVVLVPFIFAKKTKSKSFVVVLKPYNTAFFNINFCFNYLDFFSMCYFMLYVLFYAPYVILCSMCYSMLSKQGSLMVIHKCANICFQNDFSVLLLISYLPSWLFLIFIVLNIITIM